MNRRAGERLQQEQGEMSSTFPPAAMETRGERLSRIRSEIDRGAYDTPERFEAACDRMLEVLDLPR